LAEKETERESKLAERAEEREIKALQRSEEMIQTQLEQRIQSLVEKLNRGEYHGPISQPDPVTKSYNLFFEGSATGIRDQSLTAELSGEIFLESLQTKGKVSKFKITGGDLIVGDTVYDLMFGKARTSSLGQSGEKDSMVLISQVMDDEGNATTLKIFLNANTPLEGEFGTEPLDVEIQMKRSKIASEWFLSASGQISLLQ